MKLRAPKMPKMSEETINKIDQEINEGASVFKWVMIAFIIVAVWTQLQNPDLDVPGGLYKAFKTYETADGTRTWK